MAADRIPTGGPARAFEPTIPPTPTLSPDQYAEHLKSNIEDLEREVQRATGPVHLDVAGLRSASPDGVQALRSFSDRGGKIVGASPFILLLLATASAIGEEG